MPRSYSYDHFTVPKKETHLAHDERDTPSGDEEKYTEAAPVSGESKIHYGKKFAQTEELLNARRMNRQLEELAGVEADEKPAAKATAELPDAPQVQKSAPIGALPVTEEATAAMPQPMWREVLDTATGHVRMVQTAAKDLWVASFRLAKLPLEVAKLAAQRIRPQTA